METPPQSLHPQGPVHLEVRRGARESQLCPGCWTGWPFHPRPARLACSTLRAGSQLGPRSPDLGGWRKVLPPLTLLCGCLYLCRGTPSRPPRPLLALLMPCWLPGTLGVSSYSSHKRTRAKVQPEAPRPKSASLVGMGGTERVSGGAGEVSRAALWLPAGSSSTL